jgi:hypothetical protein
VASRACQFGCHLTEQEAEMRKRRVLWALVAAACAAAGGLTRPMVVSAECTFVPPLPRVSMAAATAEELFVGEVVANGPGQGFDFTVRVDEVVRGVARVGDLRRFSSVEPNWPWTTYGGGKPFPACTYLYGEVGETLIVALAARTSGGTIRDASGTWYQPPTTFSTVAITEPASASSGDPYDREVLSLDRLRLLAATSAPATDTLAARALPSPRANRIPPAILLAVFVIAVALSTAWQVHRRGLRRVR